MKREAWIGLLLAAIVLGSLPWRIHPYFAGGNEANDASIYILTAQSLLAGDGYSYLGEPFTVRPPGFSWLLTPILAWRGVDFAALHTLVALCGALAVLLFYQWLRPKTGIWVAALLALALHFNPAWERWSTQTMSDVPGVLALVGCLVVERWARVQASWKRDVCVGVLLGASAYLRSTQLILLAAIVLARLLDRDGAQRRSAARIAIIASLIIGPWMLRDAALRTDQPALQNFVHSYATGMLHSDAGDPASPARDWRGVLSEKAPEHAGKLGALLSTALSSADGAASIRWLGLSLLLACAWLAWKEREAAWLFALLYTLVLLLYFGWRDRLVLPLFPLGMAAVVLLLKQPTTRLIAAAAMLIGCVGFSSVTPSRAELAQLDRQRLQQLEAWRAVLPPQTRCAASIGWHHSVGLALPVYSIYFATRRGMSLEELVQRHRIEWILVGPQAQEQAMLPALRSRYGPGIPAADGWVFPVPSAPQPR